MTEQEAKDNLGNYIKDAAFPQTIETSEKTFHTKGLTKREYFAAMAMQGYCVNNDTINVEDALIALWSVQQADALIKALNEIQP